MYGADATFSCFDKIVTRQEACIFVAGSIGSSSNIWARARGCQTSTGVSGAFGASHDSADLVITTLAVLSCQFVDGGFLSTTHTLVQFLPILADLHRDEEKQKVSQATRKPKTVQSQEADLIVPSGVVLLQGCGKRPIPYTL